MDISFQQMKDPITGEVSKVIIKYVDESGNVWFVPLGAGHRFEDVYDKWLAAGNKPLPPE